MNARPAAVALAILAAAASRARAQAPSAPTPSASAVNDDPTSLAVQKRLIEQPAFAEMIAQRIDRSKLAAVIAPIQDPAQRLAAIRDWVAKEPESAANVAIGLYGDDARGDTTFENALLEQTTLTPVDNTAGNRGVLFNLRTAARRSILLDRQSGKLSSDEQREILRTMFEGTGAQANTVLNPAEGASAAAGPGAGAYGPATGTGGVAAGFSGYYDRLSAGNLRGYSPQLLALQSELNRRRAPGAPTLPETGKLDYATLAYPAFGMDYDIRGLLARLRRERLIILAKLAGVTLSARDLRDPDIEKKLLSKIPNARLPARLLRRAEFIARARAAMDAFLAAAAEARDPRKITRGLLARLSRLQGEAARWITAASLEEDQSRLDELDGFLTPELLAQIEAAPDADAVKSGYRQRGTELQTRLAGAHADAQAAEDILTGVNWSSGLAAAAARISSERAARAELARDIPLYSRAPGRFIQSSPIQPRWRVWLDDAAVQWLPASAYARSVASRRSAAARWRGIFEMISRSELAGAADADAQFEPPAP